MARTNDLPLYSPRPLKDWILKSHIPSSVKRALPKAVRDELLALKAMILSRDLSRYKEIESSVEDSDASASMSVVVPVHDSPLVTRRCFASLAKHAPKSEVIIVDDGSTLLETGRVFRDFTGLNGWKIINHNKSLGHSAACEAGARLATRPYLCLLNSDTVVTPWCWRLTKEVFESDSTVGVAGPSTSRSKNPQTLPLAATCLSYWNDNQICNFADRLRGECFEPLVVDVPWVSGFAFFIRRNLWVELGGFDRNLPDYGNEVELCNRVGERGYRKVWIRNSYIHHFFNQSYRGMIGDDGILARIRAAEVYIKQKQCPVDLQSQ